jgi:8-oxo-dGTP pyrophosphatase MutT (NUDIX family)
MNNFPTSAGFIIYLIDDITIKYLLVKQKGRNSWAPVKGRIESDETLMETSVRETVEEVFLINQVDYKICPHFSFQYEYQHPNGYFITNNFCTAEYLKGQNDRINIEKDELDEYKWLSLEEMRKNQHIWCRIIELFEKVEDNLRDIQRKI